MRADQTGDGYDVASNDAPVIGNHRHRRAFPRLETAGAGSPTGGTDHEPIEASVGDRIR